MNASGRDAFDAVIIGAGPVGLATAILLARRAGLTPGRIAVIDRRMPDELERVRSAAPDLRVFALSRASERILRACDAWADIRATRCEPYERMQVWHGAVSPHGGEVLVFDAAEIGEPDLGVIVENQVLQASLAGAARRAGVDLITGALESVEHEHRAVRLDVGGRPLSTRLLIGADGAMSRVRELSGLGVTRTDYGQSALVGTVRTERPHQHTAWQRFLGDGTLAFLPLVDGQSSIVWSLPTARVQKLLALPADLFERELEADFASALGSVRLTSERMSHPLWKVSAERYVSGRVALVGDAAHVVHPLAGQGANLGLLDAAALADVLAEGAAQGEDPGAERILRRYERWRRSDNQLMSAAIDAFDRLLARGNGRMAILAQRGLPWVGRSIPAKRLFIERAMGTAGELPSAAR
jgi:2-polyprenylphenol 6-hydroxylase